MEILQLITILNGKTYDSISYYYGLKDGLHYNYDSTGDLSYIDILF